MINKYLVLTLCFFLFIGFDFLYVNFLVIQEIKIADIFIVNSFLLALTFSFFFLYNILKKRSKTSGHPAALATVKTQRFAKSQLSRCGAAALARAGGG